MKLIHKEVHRGGVEAGDYTNLLYTRKLATCLGLVIHDPINKLGVFGHIGGYDLGMVQFMLERTHQLQKGKTFSDNLSGRLVLPSMTRDQEALEFMDEVKQDIPKLLGEYKGVVALKTHYCRPEYGVDLLALAPANGRIFQREFTNQEFLDRWGT